MRRSFMLLPLILIASMAPAQTASVPTGASVPAVDSRTIATTLATRLESDFVYPEQAKRYAAALNANAAAGRYDGLTGVALAMKLTDDLQAVARDGHLRVLFNGETGRPDIVMKRPEGAPAGPPKMVRLALPPIMEHAKWIAPGIAFVRFNLFPGSPEAVEAAQKFMAAHASAEAIIFDIRTHRGGGPGEMDAIFPWLFVKPTALIRMATRKSVDEAGGTPLVDGPTMRRVDADPNFVTREHWVTPGKDKRLFKAKVYVLTSGRSASAAEHFALAFKHTKRGTLIGATTAGANHFGGDQDLGGGFTAFIPVGRAYDPVSGKDWEGVGVVPDIETKPEEALTRALTLSGVSPTRAAILSAEVAPQMPMERRSPKPS
jgi:C-terminal processing protease CtpA/Prc